MQVTASGDNGSGFISHPDGLVVTSEHVVRGESSVAVWLTNGRRYDGDRAGAGRTIQFPHYLGGGLGDPYRTLSTGGGHCEHYRRASRGRAGRCLRR